VRAPAQRSAHASRTPEAQIEAQEEIDRRRAEAPRPAAAGADGSAFPDLDESADLRLVSDRASAKIDERRSRDRDPVARSPRLDLAAALAEESAQGSS
jgi:hypothetical protein